MATVTKWTPFGVALNLTATAGTITRISTNQFKVELDVSWKTYWSGAETNYAMTAASGGDTVTLNKNGNTSGGSNGKLTGTYSIDTNGASTETITVTFTNSSSTANKSASKDVTLSVSVPAWTSYAVKYNANGGSGAPGNQTKWKGQDLTLSSTKPTRTGYTFSKWNTKADGSGTSYSPGGNYEADAAVTLYAIWTAITYTVKYNANGGADAPGVQTKTYGVALTLTTVKPTRTNYNFLGWGTSASATTVAYNPGDSYTANAGITLYAIWQLAYKVPRITNYSAKRCTEDETISDDGENALVQFAWACDRDVTSIVIEIVSSDGTSTYDIEASGTSGTISMNVGGGELSTDSSYTINMIVTDSGGSYSRSVTIASNVYPIDALVGGKGVAFGKSAEVEGYADFAYHALFNNNTSIYGRDANGNIIQAFKAQDASNNVVVGWGNYYNKSGGTYVYGHDVNIGVSNAATSETYRPYYRQGDSFTVEVHLAGYVTGGGKSVQFILPITKPIVGNPKITVVSDKGFLLRQGNNYTHGSQYADSGSTYVKPQKYTANTSYINGISITATFGNSTNVTNNDAIGIQWSGTITFS